MEAIITNRRRSLQKRQTVLFKKVNGNAYQVDAKKSGENSETEATRMKNMKM